MHASYEWNPELGFKEQQGYKWIEIELDQNYQGIHTSQKHKKFYGVKQGESVQEMVHLQHNSFTITMQLWHGINIQDAYMSYSLVILMHKQNIQPQGARHNLLLPRQFDWSINAPKQLKTCPKLNY